VTRTTVNYSHNKNSNFKQQSSAITRDTCFSANDQRQSIIIHVLVLAKAYIHTKFKM